MKIWKPLVFGLLFVGGITLSGCHLQEGGTKLSQEESTQQEAGMKQKEISKGVLESFESTLKYYPTPKIEDILDENMGSQAILQSEVSKQKNDKEETPLVSTGMVLYIDTSTKKGHGYYFEDTYYKDPADKDKKKKYPVIYNNGIYLKQRTGNSELDKKIENFKFLFQYADFGNLSQKKLMNADYNPEVPLFSAEYQLSNDDTLIKRLRKDYGFNQKEAPVLVLDGRGNYKNQPTSNFDYRDIDIYFSKNPKNSIGSSIVYNNNSRKEGDY